MFTTAQTLGRALTVLLLATTPLAAQNAQASPPSPSQLDAAALLDKAIKKMARVPSVRFKTTETVDSAMMRVVAKQAAAMGGAPSARGTVCICAWLAPTARKARVMANAATAAALKRIHFIDKPL